MNAIVLISADAEWEAVRQLLPNLELQPSPFGESSLLTLDGQRVLLFHGGWGKISAAASTQYVIDHFRPDLLINLGTCGGFAGQIERGEILLVERTVVYDILEQMGEAAQAIRHYASSLDLSWIPAPEPYPVRRGILLSADRDIVPADIPLLIEKYNALAADWESGAIAWVAQKNNVPCLILRAVSDLVAASGGEAYGDYELFRRRTGEIMARLFAQLPAWLRLASRHLEGCRPKH
jgi:adenosylhomocysteine nucleosidase